MEYFGGSITIILSILAIQLVYVAVIAFFGVNTNPIIDNVNDEIISSQSIFFMVSTSCLYFKNIKIDKRKKLVKISKRILWFFKSVENIYFNEIYAIKYGYYFVGKTIHVGGYEEFYVSIILYNNNEVKLFSFYGLEDSGSQEDTSKIFVEKMAKLMDKRIS